MSSHTDKPSSPPSTSDEVSLNLLDLAADASGLGPPHALGRQLPAMVARLLRAAGIEVRSALSTVALEGDSASSSAGLGWAVPAGELEPGKAIELSRRLGPARFLAYGELGPERREGMSLIIRVLRRHDAEEVLKISRRFFVEEIDDVVRAVARSLAALDDRQDELDRVDTSEALGSSNARALLKLGEGLDALASYEAGLAGSDLSGAIRLLLEALEHDSQCALAREQALAALASEIGRSVSVEQGLELGRRLSEAVPLDRDVALLLARLLQKAGRPAEALDALRQVAPDGPDAAEALEMARLHQELGEIKQTLEMTELALGDGEKMPSESQAEALELHGVSLARLGRMDEALPYLERASELTPDNGRLWANLGRCHHLLGHLDEALDAYRRGVELSPDSWEAARNLASLLLDVGDVDHAQELLERWVGDRPRDPEPALALAELLMSREDALDQARAVLVKATDQISDDPRIHALLGGVLVGLGDHTGAEHSYRRALELNPNDPAMMSNLALVLSTLGRNSEAEPLARRAVEIAPNDLVCLQVLDHLRRMN